MLLTRHPGRPLGYYVETLWYYEGYETDTHRERVLPNGRCQIVLDFSTGLGVVCGLRSHYIEIDPSTIHMVMGVVFRPGGAHGFLGVPASDFYNKVVPLDEVWRTRMTGMCDRLSTSASPQHKLQILETALQNALRRGTLHPSLQHALRAFHRIPHIQTVEDFSKEVGLSRRRFSQLFREQVGMTPKLYCRLMRFRDVLRQISTGGHVDWAEVAMAGGYYDQAHLAHEFREFSGFSPSSYLTAARPYENHIRIE